MPRVTKDPEVRRTELLDTAFALIQEVGYEAMSVEAVTSAAGVAKGTFYHYFATKEEVVLQLVGRFGAGMLERLSALVADTPGPAMAKLQALIAGASKFKTEHVGEYEWMDFLYRNENRLLRHGLYTAWADAMRQVMRPVIEQGVADGSFRVLDIDTTADAVVALWYEATDRLWLRAIAEDDADSFARVIITGGAAIQQAQERLLGIPDGSIDFSIDQKLVDAVKPFYEKTREVIS